MSSKQARPAETPCIRHVIRGCRDTVWELVCRSISRSARRPLRSLTAGVRLINKLASTTAMHHRDRGGLVERLFLFVSTRRHQASVVDYGSGDVMSTTAAPNQVVLYTSIYRTTLGLLDPTPHCRRSHGDSGSAAML